MSKKKYFWLKLHKDFFKSREIKKLRKTAGGDTFVIIYLKMQLLSIESNGIIEYEGIEPTFAEEMALELDEEESNVNATVLFLESMGMLKQVEEDSFLIPHVADLTGSETPQARSMRKKRAIENQQVTLKNVTLLQSSYNGVKTCEKNVTLELEKELEKDIKEKIYPPQNEVECVSVVDNEKESKFEKFWSYYGYKKEKKKAKNNFMKLSERQLNEIQHRLPMYVKNTFINGEFPSRMYPARYLQPFRVSSFGQIRFRPLQDRCSQEQRHQDHFFYKTSSVRFQYLTLYCKRMYLYKCAIR